MPGGGGWRDEGRGERKVLVLDELGGGRRHYGEAGSDEKERANGRHGLSYPKKPIVAGVRVFGSVLTAIALLAAAAPAGGQTSTDWITGLPREAIHVTAWPGGKKVAVCFVLYVEVWGHDQGPNFRPDMNGRTPDVVDEAFRQYAINWGVPRIGRLFKEMGAPLSLALNA